MEDVEIPEWLKRLPLAPVYHPTETEFADPIAYISKIEKEASTFGICKVVPPIPKPSKRHVLSNLNKSLAKCSDLRLDVNCDSLPNCSDVGASVGGNEAGSRAVFTTRHQELGHSLKRIRGSISCKQAGSIKQVWQSGEHYTLNQFESKSKVFARSYLGNVKDLSPLVIESGFWKAACDKPIYIEYANDVPGSAFGQPVESYRHIRKRCRTQTANQGSRKSEGNVASGVNCSQENGKDEEFPEVTFNGDKEGTAGWKLSNSPWNLQVIARSRGSLTRFMPDDVPGVTSPMIYIGMLFSWFAWHVEDHELHSMNFLHLGSPKTWYGIPGDYAFALEDIVREHCYGGELDHLAALSLLGEKTTLLSPEVVVASNIPCCRLIQYPGEFVVTFPRAYHVGFSHGFNCGEAANFATPQWLKVAREAAVRRAAMNYLPMLSHQQLLYLLSMSFISRIPSILLPGIRSSRFKDRIKEERENLVKKAFIDDMVKENDRLDILLKKESTFGAVYWDPEMLPPTNSSSSISAEVRDKNDIQVLCESINEDNDDSLTNMKESSYMNSDEDDLPCGLHVESGALSCVACGILGYPFMSIVQPSENALEFLIQGIEKKKYMLRSLMPCTEFNMDKHRRMTDSGNGASDDHPEKLFDTKDDVDLNARINILKSNPSDTLPCQANSFSGDDLLKKHGNWRNGLQEKMSNVSTNTANTNFSKSEGRITTDSSLTLSGCAILNPNSCTGGEEPLNAPEVDGYNATRKKWTTSIGFLRPRIFCLEHCLEVEQLLEEHGGANVLLICHSDYPKIKEEAISAAELFSVDFRCKEMKLQTASPADLDLINIAVDDGQQEECEKDWTSSLGVNLKYGVMLRKMSPPKQEKLTLALGGLFSDKVGASNRLNWVSRKCRSQNKEKSPTPKLGISKGDQVTEVPKLVLSDDITGGACSPLPNNRTHGRGRPRRSAIENDTIVHDEESDLMAVSVSYASSLLDISIGTNIKPCESEAALQIDATAESFKPFIRSGSHSICLSTTCEILQEVPIQMANSKFDLQMAIDMTGSMEALPATVLSPTEPLEQLDIHNVEQVKNATNVLENRKLGESLAASVQVSDDSRMLSYNAVATSSATEGMPVVVKGSGNLVLRDSPSSTAECFNNLQKTDDDCNIQVSTSSNAILDYENFRMKHKNCTLEETTSDACGSAKFVGLPIVPTSAMEDPELQQEMNTRVEDNILNDICSQGDECPDDFPAHMGSEQKKRTYKEKLMAKNQFNHTEFVRSPCEGLRPRISRVVPANHKTSRHLRNKKPRVIKNSDGHRKCGAKYKDEEEVYGCDIDGCNMSFSTEAELRDHKRNCCTHEGCGKRFSSHRYAMLHLRVHIDERPFKCVWKGCGMTFKWAWALTEHTRVHTRERPYSCKVKGCGLTFRFVSDFSRHRRRTGHSVV